MNSSESVLYQAGMNIAAALHVHYNGIQKDRYGLFAGHTFTDPQTKGTFLARDAVEGYKKLEDMRSQLHGLEMTH